jgi:membrane-associated phospholipid phosphatase
MATRRALPLLLLLAIATPARADDVIHPWELLGSSLEASFGWRALPWYGAAIVITPPFVWSADARIQEAFQKPPGAREAFGQTAFIVGGGAPVVVPLAIYLSGLGTKQSELATAGAAALQAAAIQAVFVGALKWITDRAGPYPDGDPKRKRRLSTLFHDSMDPADFDFNPFDIRGGLRWPSGHTASNVALVSALFAFYPDELWIPAVGYPIALAIGVGMIEGDYHWFSDVVAGALIGHIIGWSVGRNFRAHYDAQRSGGLHKPAAGVEFVPSPQTPLALHGWF